MKYYLQIRQILDEFDVNVPEQIRIEVENKEDAIIKANQLKDLVGGNKKIEFETCRHEENLPCISETL